MSRTRQMIVAFWVIIIALLIWEFYDYNRGMTKEAVEHPKQEHFFFYKTNDAPVAPPTPAHRDGAEVIQTMFDVKPNTPMAGSFTCNITLRNVGNARARNVQVNARPFKGIALGDVDGGHAKTGTFTDNDAASQINQWVTFPDLAPGESATEKAIFISRADLSPGTNPQPQIIFESDKTAPGATPAPAPQHTPQTPPAHRAPAD